MGNARFARPRRALSAPVLVEQLEDRRLLSGGTIIPNGTSSSLAMDSNGKLWVLYHNSADGTLRYVVRDADGTWQNIPNNIIDSPGASSETMGLYLSAALDSTGKPGVAYYDSFAADLKYAHWNGSSWDVQSAVASSLRAGMYPSLVYQADKPTISHYTRNGSATLGWLRIDQGNSPNATVWTASSVGPATADNGRFSSLVFNGAKWGIVYDESTAGNPGPRFAETTGTSVSSASWGSVASVPMPPGMSASEAVWNSLVYDNNTPAFAWYASGPADLNFSRRSSGWSSYTVAANSIVGKYPTLFFEGSNQFRIASFYDAANNKKVQVRTGTDSSWTLEDDLVVGGGSALSVLRRSGVNTFAWSQDGSLFVNDDQIGTGWTKQSGATAFGGRKYHSSVAFDAGDSYGSQMWIIGGQIGTQKTDSIYASNNGLNWHQVRSNGQANGFGGRILHASVSFDDQDVNNPGSKMWVLGGMLGSSTVGDVWRSDDGANWTQMYDGANPVSIGARNGHNAVVFDGKMFVIGGGDGGSGYGDVRYSSDGVTWTSISDSSFAQRTQAVALVYNGAIYLIGGTGTNIKTYKSNSTGTSWTELDDTPTPSFVAARGVVYDNKMWIVDGLHAYWSVDGVNWTTVAADPDGVSPFDTRSAFTALTFAKSGDSQRMWILGGLVTQGDIYKDDAWSSD